MPKKRGGRAGGMGKQLFAAVWLVVVAGGLLGFAQVNNISTAQDLIDYVKAWSDKTDECIGANPKTLEDLSCGPGSGSDATPDPSVEPDPGPSSEIPTAPEVASLQKELKSLKVPSSVKVPYERGDWRHWSDLDKNGCDSRQDVLIQQARPNTVKTEPDDACDVVKGEWTSPYEGKKITDPSAIDIDHVIPLGYAATHGGQDWPASTKERFANDFSQLLATSASENRSKSDKGPGAYMPDRVEYWCAYSQIWVKTAAKYGLWIETSDRAALEKGLATC